jgi:hypothetical protein
MNIPKTVKVGGHLIPVRVKGGVRVGDEDCVGSFESNKMEISIDARVTTSLKEYAFWHESLHAIDYDRGTGLKEGQIQALAGGLYAFLKDNGLVK